MSRSSSCHMTMCDEEESRKISLYTRWKYYIATMQPITIAINVTPLIWSNRLHLNPREIMIKCSRTKSVAYMSGQTRQAFCVRGLLSLVEPRVTITSRVPYVIKGSPVVRSTVERTRGWLLKPDSVLMVGKLDLSKILLLSLELISLNKRMANVLVKWVPPGPWKG